MGQDTGEKLALWVCNVWNAWKVAMWVTLLVTLRWQALTKALMGREEMGRDVLSFIHAWRPGRSTWVSGKNMTSDQRWVRRIRFSYLDEMRCEYIR